MQKCFDKRNAGKLPACPDLKTGTALAKLAATVSVSNLAAACPPEVLGDPDITGECARNASPNGVALCLVSEAKVVVDSLLELENARPNEVLPAVTDWKCQATIAKELGTKYALSRVTAFAVCSEKADNGKRAACLDPGAAGKLAKAVAKLPGTIAKRCTDPLPAVLAGEFGAPCDGVTSIAALVSCEVTQHDLATNRLLNVLP